MTNHPHMCEPRGRPSISIKKPAKWLVPRAALYTPHMPLDPQIDHCVLLPVPNTPVIRHIQNTVPRYTFAMRSSSTPLRARTVRS